MSAARLMQETLVDLGAAARLVPVPVSRWSVARWVTRGVRVGGVSVRLEAVRVGGRWFTSGPAVVRFLDEQTRLAAVGSQAPAPTRTPAAAGKAHLKADAELAAMGM